MDPARRLARRVPRAHGSAAAPRPPALVERRRRQDRRLELAVSLDASSVPNSGTPRMKLWVPSIGSMYQRRGARPPRSVLLADEAVVREAAGIRPRISRSIALSASVTNVRSGLVSISRSRRKCGERDARPPRRRAASASVEPAVELGVRAARQDGATTPARILGPCSRADPLARRVAQRLAGDLEADPLAEDLDLAAASRWRASGGR